MQRKKSINIEKTHVLARLFVARVAAQASPALCCAALPGEGAPERGEAGKRDDGREKKDLDDGGIIRPSLPLFLFFFFVLAAEPSVYVSFLSPSHRAMSGECSLRAEQEKNTLKSEEGVKRAPSIRSTGKGLRRNRRRRQKNSTRFSLLSTSKLLQLPPARRRGAGRDVGEDFEVFVFLSSLNPS